MYVIRFPYIKLSGPTMIDPMAKPNIKIAVSKPCLRGERADINPPKSTANMVVIMPAKKLMMHMENRSPHFLQIDQLSGSFRDISGCGIRNIFFSHDFLLFVGAACEYGAVICSSLIERRNVSLSDKMLGWETSRSCLLLSYRRTEP